MLAVQEVVPRAEFSTHTVEPKVLVFIRLMNCGVMSIAMMEPPSHGSTLSFLEAL